jgi:signal transduction histidine kinase
VPAAPAPAQYQPTLRWYSHAWRLALCLVVSSLAWSNSWQGQWQDHRPLFWIDLGVGLVAFGLSFLRRRWPFRIALLLAALGAVSAFASGPAILAAVSFASRRQIGRIIALGMLVVVASQAYADTQPVSPQSGFHVQQKDDTGDGTFARSTTSVYLDFLTNVLFTSAVLGWGMYIGSRRELLWTLRETAREAESERDLRVASARTNERATIAREMHDVLAHRISQVSMQAGAMAFRDDLGADELRAGAQLIQTQANQALNELRGVLGVLRSPKTGELLDRPQPTYADLDALIEDSRQAGMHIDYQDLIGTASDIPIAAGRTIFRIVQEGLTNAAKHAPGALVRVELSGSPAAGIDVLLRNAVGFAGTPAAPGSGLGLIGLAERTALRGGRLEHRRDGSTFVLHGWIPWAA